jgi:hypothetical protein
MTLKGKYWVAKQAKKIGSEIENINDRRNELIKKYGKEKDGQPSIDQKDTKAMKKFTDDFEALLKEEIELDIQPLKYEYIDPLKLKPSVLMDLDYLIAEPVDNVEEKVTDEK